MKGFSIYRVVDIATLSMYNSVYTRAARNRLIPLLLENVVQAVNLKARGCTPVQLSRLGAHLLKQPTCASVRARIVYWTENGQGLGSHEVQVDCCQGAAHSFRVPTDSMGYLAVGSADRHQLFQKRAQSRLAYGSVLLSAAE